MGNGRGEDSRNRQKWQAVFPVKPPLAEEDASVPFIAFKHPALK
jgi:hypothetical protein